MTFKEFWKESWLGVIAKNILIAAVIVGAFIWITFKLINVYTEHGVTEFVPDLKGMYVEEAEVILKAQKLYPQVIDSIYDREKRLGTIIEQIPAPNATIKHNRPIYLIVNAQTVRKIPLPGIIDYSSRQATAMIQASGIEVESVQYAPSEYRDLVIDIKYRGESIYPGHMIPEGDAVVLIVGNGLGDEEATIPNLRGLSLDEARNEIMASFMTLGAVYYDDDENTESTNYIIYRQQPTSGRTVPSGTRIDVWLSTDRTLLDNTPEEFDINQEEEFF